MLVRRQGNRSCPWLQTAAAILVLTSYAAAQHAPVSIIVADKYSKIRTTFDGVENITAHPRQTTRLERRMGVIGVRSTALPPDFRGPLERPHEPSTDGRVRNASQITNHFLKLGRPLPLSPHSPHNIFSLHEDLLGLQQTRISNDTALQLTPEQDLDLKLKALTKAQEDSQLSFQHVKGNVSTKCDAFITEEEFYIRSPNYPYNYPANTTCEYQVYRRDSEVCGIQLTVLRFDLASADPVTGYCRDNFQVQGRPFCGRRQRGDTALILFPGLLLTMKLETGSGYGASGLLLQGRQVTDCRTSKQLSRPIVSNPPCISTMRSERFSLLSPGYPDAYPHNSECWYHIIRRSAGYCGVELIVNSFALESASCMFDYVETGHKRICGRKTPGTKYYFPFENNKLLVRFRSDESISRQGFQLTGKQVKCDDLKDFKETYNDPKTLEDFIAATAGRKDFIETGIKPNAQKEHHDTDNDDDDINYILTLAGRPSLSLEEEQPSRQHLGRELVTSEVEAMYDLSDTELEVITDPDIGVEVTSPYNPFVVSDVTDTVGVPLNESDPYAITTGATSSISDLQPDINGLPTPTLTLIEDSSDSNDGKMGPCDVVYTGDSFTLRSPKPTGDLPKKLDCSFLIRKSSPEVCEIHMTLVNVSLAPRTKAGRCEGEYLEVAGSSFCGGDQNKQVRVRASGQLVRLRLHADEAQNTTGFTVLVQQLRGAACEGAAVPSSMNCDVRVTQELSTLLSPHYPDPYPSNLNCGITIAKAAHDIQSVTLYLDEFNVEDSFECQKDYFTAGGIRICGNRSGEKISFRFPDNELVMAFRSNGFLSSKGYRLHVKQNRFPVEQHSFTQTHLQSGSHFGRPPPPPFTSTSPFGVTNFSRPISPPFASASPFGETHFSLPPPPFTSPPHFSRPQPPPFSSVSHTCPSTTPRPPPQHFGSGFTTTVTSRPPTVEAATDLPTITECGESVRHRVVVIKSPGYPDSPPKNLHCVYNIEKYSNDVCQLKIQIRDLQIGTRVECGRSFLQVGSQQRLCGARWSDEVRTYHFTEDVMQLIFHTEPEGQDGGFHISVEQLPCGNFEPIGTFGGLHTVSETQILTGGRKPHKETSVDIIPIDNILDADHSAGSDPVRPSFVNVDTSHHFISHGNEAYPPFQHKPTTHPDRYQPIHPHTEHSTDIHYLYYYVPNQSYNKQPRPQRGTTVSSKLSKGSSGGYDFMKSMKEKFDKFKDSIYKEENSYVKGRVQVEAEIEHKRPSRPHRHRRTTPLATTTTNRPYIPQNGPVKYRLVINPHYNPNSGQKNNQYSTPFRNRRPQAHHSAAKPLTYSGRYHNAYIVIPSSQLPAREVEVSSPIPVLYSTPQPTVALPRPIHFPALVYTATTSRPVLRVEATTPRPAVRVVSATHRPSLAVTPVPPLTGSTVFIAPSSTPATVRLPSSPQPVSSYSALLISTTPPGRAQLALHRDELQVAESSVTPVKDCGRVITEEQFTIRSPAPLPNSLNQVISCTYTVAKSKPDKCSLVLEMQDYQLTGACTQPTATHCRPTVNMLTSFTASGDLQLQFNVTADSGATFTLRGRQLPCSQQQHDEGQQPATNDLASYPSTTVHTGSTLATSSEGMRGWKAINPSWIGPGGRGRKARTIIAEGARGVRQLRSILRPPTLRNTRN